MSKTSFSGGVSNYLPYDYSDAFLDTGWGSELSSRTPETLGEDGVPNTAERQKTESDLDYERKKVSDTKAKITFWSTIIATVYVVVALVLFFYWQFGNKLYFALPNSAGADGKYSWIIWILLLITLGASIWIGLKLFKEIDELKDNVTAYDMKQREESKSRYENEELPEMMRAFDNVRNRLIEDECEKIALQTYVPSTRIIFGFVFGICALVSAIAFLLLQPPKSSDDTIKAVFAGFGCIAGLVGTIVTLCKQSVDRKENMLKLLFERDDVRIAMIIATTTYDKEIEHTADTTLSKIAVEMAKTGKK